HGTLSTGGTDRYVFAVQESEILSTASGTFLLGIEVMVAPGSALQPALPVIAGLAPVASNVSPGDAFALYAFDRPGLQPLQVSGADAATAGAYTLRLFMPGDVNGDGMVDASDALAVSAALGLHVGDKGYVAALDADRDGVIDAR